MQQHIYDQFERDLILLIEDVHRFHGQSVFRGQGQRISQKKKIFGTIFIIIGIASKNVMLNMIMLILIIMGYNILRVPKGNPIIFQYGVSQNNLAAFQRLNRCLEPRFQSKICMNGGRPVFWSRLTVALGFRRLWIAAKTITLTRHPTPLVHLQSTLSAAAAIMFEVLPLPDSIRVVCVASDHSPISMALLAASRRSHKATCYIQHAPVSEYFPPLKYDLSVLYDQSSIEIYREIADKYDLTFEDTSISLLPPFSKSFQGVRHGKNPFKIGLCLSFLPDIENLKCLINSLSSRSDVEKICLRPHPRCQLNWSRIVVSPKVELQQKSQAAVDFFENIDIALVPNSGVTIDALHYGCPTYFVPDTDTITEDYYGFFSKGILPIFCLTVLEFPMDYFDEAWKSRFSQYDATTEGKLTEFRCTVSKAFNLIVR